VLSTPVCDDLRCKFYLTCSISVHYARNKVSSSNISVSHFRGDGDGCVIYYAAGVNGAAAMLICLAVNATVACNLQVV